MRGNEFGSLMAAKMGQTAFEKSRLFRAKVTSVTNRATVGIKCEIESTGETVYVEAAGAATVYEIAVNDYVWVKRLTDGQRNSWILAGFAEDSGGSHVPSLRAEIGKISELWASDGDPQAVDVDTAGNISVLKDLQLDDGAGDSPALKVIGGTNDDTFSIYLDDDAVAGKSELIIEMCGAGGNSGISLYDSTLTKFLTIDSAGNLILMDNVGAALVIRDIGGNDDYLTFVTTNDQREVVVNQDGADIDFRAEDNAGNNVIVVRASDGHLGLGRGGAGTAPLVQISNTGATISAGYYNFYSYVEKTGGTGAFNLYSVFAAANLNQSGGTVNDLAGLYGRVYMTQGTVNNDAFGCYFMLDMNGGTVTDDGIALMVFLDMDGGTISGDAVGLVVQVDVDAGTVSGSVINTLIDVRTGNHYGIYQDGGAGVMNYFEGDISADQLIDRSLHFRGDAVSALKAIRDDPASIEPGQDWSKIDHASLIEGVARQVPYRRWYDKKTREAMPVGWTPTEKERDNYERRKELIPGRSLSGQISVNVRAIVQLAERIETLEEAALGHLN